MSFPDSLHHYVGSWEGLAVFRVRASSAEVTVTRASVETEALLREDVGDDFGQHLRYRADIENGHCQLKRMVCHQRMDEMSRVDLCQVFLY